MKDSGPNGGRHSPRSNTHNVRMRAQTHTHTHTQNMHTAGQFIAYSAVSDISATVLLLSRKTRPHGVQTANMLDVLRKDEGRRIEIY
jgi:hypothetical protein